MKRWQDRGEVADSDDEENSLELDVDEQRPFKRVKIGDESPGITQRAEDGEIVRPDGEVAGELDVGGQSFINEDATIEDDEDEEWIQPKATVTYGRRQALPTVQKYEEAYGPSRKSQHEPAVDDALSLSSPVVASGQTDISPLDDRGNSSPPSSDSEDLPDVHEILARRNAAQPDQNEQPQLLSVQSSPLSERALSPSPPPQLRDIFRFSTSPFRASTTTEQVTSRSINSVVDTVRSPTDVQNFAGTRRRNLRTRNEKQLHPYMFDKAQYQQQCRERGMRPVRVMEAALQTAETQGDSSNDEEGSSSQILFDRNSSSQQSRSQAVEQRPQNESNDASRRHLYGSAGNENDSEDELPDLREVMPRPVLNGIQQGSKRRRLFSLGHRDTAKSVRANGSHDQDDFSIPPSPPPTSSEQNNSSSAASAVPRFRPPRGLTPRNSLPTPRVSSDIRPTNLDSDSATSDEELLSRRSGLPTSSRKIVAISSSSESSEAESEPDRELNIDDRRLHRERKRIKGVLPASWLKIDFRAQQKPLSPTKSGARRADSSSLDRRSPQKGVAQRVTYRKSTSPNRLGFIEISDDESGAEPESRRSSPSPPRMRQSRLDFEPKRRPLPTQAFADVDDMEVDWIDPMFGGSSSTRASRPSKKQQLKIADAFKGAPRRRPVDLSEERRGLSNILGTSGARQRPSKKARKSRKQYPKAARLGIMDAPAQESEPRFRLPQFVRVAMRTASTRTDNARQSPTHKHVRLATREDTAVAEDVLSAWRQGTIQPRQTTPTSHPAERLAAQAERSEHRAGPTQKLRTPLTELSRNVPRRNPFELQDKSSKPKLRQVTIAQKSRLQQTRLKSEVIERDAASPEQDEPREAPPLATKARHLRPQPPKVQYRGAQLESLESEFDQSHRTAAFERRMHLLTESVARSRGTNIVQLDRFIYGSTPAPPMSADEATVRQRNAAPMDAGTVGPGVARAHSKHVDIDLEIPGPKAVLPHRNRKRVARRIDAEAREYRQPSEPLPEIVDVEQLPDNVPAEPVLTLQGLGPFGTRYATDFDVLPLAVGTYFHESSFIGSGDFAAALNFAGRDLDKLHGRLSIHVDGEVLDWGPWTEEVASGLSRIPRAISGALVSPDPVPLVLSNVDYLLRSVTRYFSRCLAFLDSIDRRSCIGRMYTFVEDLFEVLDENEISPAPGTIHEIKVRCFQHALVIAKQALVLSKHDATGRDAITDSQKLVDRAAHRLAGCVLPRAFQDLRTFYDDNRHVFKREAGIRDDTISVTSLVILYHVLHEPEVNPSPFWTMIYQHMNVDMSGLIAANQFDKVWYDIFTLLPTLEIDSRGIAQIGSRLLESTEDWTVVRKLMERIFGLYDASSTVSGSSVNDYIRALLPRCFRLVTRWGWWRCESILGIIFDFFARRGLSQLHKEDSRGSPTFLEELKDVPALEVQPGEPSFHIFLKLLASSLIGMRQHGAYSEKKIGSIAWRFIPNHGRTYRKDAEVKQQDLDALRNHHDLLCTLYYATPSKDRFRVDLLRNLVDHSVSHREACRLSVRAWANLAGFQISTNEDNEQLEPLIGWYREMLTTTITQYRQARNEVEQDVELARAQGEAPMPQHIIDDTIARNQRQIAATLVDLLVAVKRALQAASSMERATYLLKGCAFWDVLELYDPSARRLNSVLDETLSVVQTALQAEHAFSAGIESQSNSDESQDYGDSSALFEFASTQQVMKESSEFTMNLLHEPINQLLSNLFGADTAADDALLTKAVDTWVQLAQRKVRSGESSWATYLDGYTSASWTQLRDTAHHRKLTPYFIASVVRTAGAGLASFDDVFGFWLVSLVTRESMLQYEHILTDALISQYENKNSLLWNLPVNSGLSLHEFRTRRLALISSVLSNMSKRNSHGNRQTRSEHAALLKRMMATMKVRYQEQEQGGSYVQFVQHVIGFMQQYTSEICAVDAFFTDSNAFPLPVSDPTYLASRLKSYAPKLDSLQHQKQLVIFIKSMSERAAVEQQQDYLVEQLISAMSLEPSYSEQASRLRHMLLTAVLPAYIVNATTTPCLWIMARPVIQACGRTAEKLLYQTAFDDQSSIDIAINILQILLNGMTLPVSRKSLTMPHVLATLCTILEAARQCLTVAKYVLKVRNDSNLGQIVENFCQFAANLEAAFVPSADVDEMEMIESTRVHCLFQASRDYADTQLGSLNETWSVQDEKYYLRRGGKAEEVFVEVGSEMDERSRLLEAIQVFNLSYMAIFHGARRSGEQCRENLSSEIVV